MSLFGGNTFTQPAQQQQQQPPSLFSNLNAPQQASVLQNSFNAPSQQQNNTGSLFGTSLLNSQHGQNAGQSRLGGLNLTPAPRGKPIPDQIQTLLSKWNPQAPTCTLESYFYNAVTPALAPYYAPAPDEDEAKWSEALSKKPDESSVPVRVRGFHELGKRVEQQNLAVTELRRRLHEMNNSLTAVMDKHSRELSIRISEARRKHLALSQRCLRLAVKSQILRNRGYALDGGEEGLRTALLALEKQTFDPRTAGREEEIWARMVALRERARYLEAEGARVAKNVAEGAGGGVPEEVLGKAKRILADYDGQLTTLHKELKKLLEEFGEWEKDNKGA